jgi:hypothetical protein
VLAADGIELAEEGRQRRRRRQVRVGVLGAGNYATAMFLPAMQKVGGAALATIASAQGLSARMPPASSASRRVVGRARGAGRPGYPGVVLLTRHQHTAARCWRRWRRASTCTAKSRWRSRRAAGGSGGALQGGNAAAADGGLQPALCPAGRGAAGLLAGRSEPLAAHYRVNAGYIPLTHWLHDPEQGGGRIIGEGCHFVDFLTFLVGSRRYSVSARPCPTAGATARTTS